MFLLPSCLQMQMRVSVIMLEFLLQWRYRYFQIYVLGSISSDVFMGILILDSNGFLCLLSCTCTVLCIFVINSNFITCSNEIWRSKRKFAPQGSFILFSATMVYISTLFWRSAENRSSFVVCAYDGAGKDSIMPNFCRDGTIPCSATGS